MASPDAPPERGTAWRPVAGAVDLGSNSVHLLVAAIDGHRLEPLVDESVFLGLGDAVHDAGALGRVRRAELVSTLERYAQAARDLGARSVTFLGTEPLRRAADAAAIVHAVESVTRAPLHVLSHEEEAYLTLIGVTEGRPVEHDTLVVDIGGGSSEFALVGPGRPAEAWGLRLGSARLTSGHVAHDPPTTEELAAMAAGARAILEAPERAVPLEIVGVGGTASNLVKLLPAAMADGLLTRDRLDAIERVLATEPAAAIAERYILNPARARVLPAGGVILAAILERHGVEALRVSDASLREGTILAVQQGGPSWRDRLADLVHGWRS